MNCSSVTNFFSFCLEGKYFIFPLFLQDSFARYGLCGCQLLFFQPFDYVISFPMVCMVFAEKFFVSQIEFPFVWLDTFCLLFSRILSSLLDSTFTIMSLEQDFCEWMSLGIFEPPEFGCPDLSQDLEVFKHGCMEWFYMPFPSLPSCTSIIHMLEASGIL